jgi:hypothetical protein
LSILFATSQLTITSSFAYQAGRTTYFGTPSTTTPASS